jgi:hypothetical protein
MSKHKERIGMCVRCKEYTSVEDSCCGSGVYFEGSIEFPDEDDAECDHEGMVIHGGRCDGCGERGLESDHEIYLAECPR